VVKFAKSKPNFDLFTAILLSSIQIIHSIASAVQVLPPRKTAEMANVDDEASVQLPALQIQVP
jgi:hypothetical protein